MTLFDYDDVIRREGFAAICGVDEAGRGPLAGPVYAAAVVLPPGVVISGVNDSKKLSEKHRERLFDEIIRVAASYCVAQASVEEIDAFNILEASMLAMRRAAQGISANFDIVLADGNRDPGIGSPTRTVIGGDAASASIAAASILAKVSRDRHMLELDALYPQYQFAKHKGYGTKLHYEMLEKYGESPVHRKSFLKKWRAKANEQ